MDCSSLYGSGDKPIMKIADIRELRLRVIKHRMEVHDTKDMKESFDCAVCRALEARSRDLEHTEELKRQTV